MNETDELHGMSLHLTYMGGKTHLTRYAWWTGFELATKFEQNGITHNGGPNLFKHIELEESHVRTKTYKSMCKHNNCKPIEHLCFINMKTLHHGRSINIWHLPVAKYIMTSSNSSGYFPVKRAWEFKERKNQYVFLQLSFCH